MSKPDGNQGFPIVPDAKDGAFSAGSFPQRSVGDIPLPHGLSDNEPNEYKMDRQNRGHAVIINNKCFRDLPERTGTDIDHDRMLELLGILGFRKEHIKEHLNCTADQMKEVLNTASQIDYEQFDCFVAVILTHGKNDGDLCGTDTSVSIDDLTGPFKGTRCHKTLGGKPKIFIIQACRGEADSEAMNIENDAIEDEDDADLQIPAEADFLLAFSVIPGFRAWRHEAKGSWYIQSVNKVFRKRWQKEDLVSMLTEVNKTVAIDYGLRDKIVIKQMPCFSSRLTKKIYFRHSNHFNDTI